jgi:hypothetical protein
MINHGQKSFEVFLESVDTSDCTRAGMLISTFSTTKLELVLAFSFLAEPLRSEVVNAAIESAKESNLVAKDRYFFRLYNF